MKKYIGLPPLLLTLVLVAACENKDKTPVQKPVGDSDGASAGVGGGGTGAGGAVTGGRDEPTPSTCTTQLQDELVKGYDEQKFAAQKLSELLGNAGVSPREAYNRHHVALNAVLDTTNNNASQDGCHFSYYDRNLVFSVEKFRAFAREVQAVFADITFIGPVRVFANIGLPCTPKLIEDFNKYIVRALDPANPQTVALEAAAQSGDRTLVADLKVEVLDVSLLAKGKVWFHATEDGCLLSVRNTQQEFDVRKLHQELDAFDERIQAL